MKNFVLKSWVRPVSTLSMALVLLCTVVAARAANEWPSGTFTESASLNAGEVSSSLTVSLTVYEGSSNYNFKLPSTPFKFDFGIEADSLTNGVWGGTGKYFSWTNKPNAALQNYTAPNGVKMKVQQGVGKATFTFTVPASKQTFISSQVFKYSGNLAAGKYGFAPDQPAYYPDVYISILTIPGNSYVGGVTAVYSGSINLTKVGNKNIAKAKGGVVPFYQIPP